MAPQALQVESAKIPAAWSFPVAELQAPLVVAYLEPVEPEQAELVRTQVVS